MDLKQLNLQQLKDNVLDTSKIKDYQRCPRYFFYRHVLGWDSESPNNHLVFGSAWHEAMEHLLLNGYSPNSIVAAYDKFLRYYRSYLPAETDALFDPKTPDRALYVLSKYARNYANELDNLEVLYTEIAGKVMIDSDKALAFRMDSVIKDRKTGRVFSREHKTGSRVWMWDEQWLLDLQPGTYSHVLYCLYPYEEVDRIEMNGVFFIKRKTDPYDFHRFDVRRTKAQMQVWLNSMRYHLWEISREYEVLEESSDDAVVMQAFPLRESSCISYGKVCDFQDFCLAWPNPLRRALDPPLGFQQRFWNPLEQEAKKVFEFETKGY